MPMQKSDIAVVMAISELDVYVLVEDLPHEIVAYGVYPNATAADRLWDNVHPNNAQHFSVMSLAEYMRRHNTPVATRLSDEDDVF